MIVLLGPGAQEEVMRHTFTVLNHFSIPFQTVDWKDNRSLDLISDMAARGAGVIVLGTGFPYTDEHLPEDIVLPVLKVITAHPPDSGQLLTSTSFVGTVGFGDDGAVNAGLHAARILALSDPALRDLLLTKPYVPS